MKYLRERREALGGSVPIAHQRRRRRSKSRRSPTTRKSLDKLVGKTGELSTTMGFVRLLRELLRDKKIGKYIVPIVPDESRTFGMEALFRQVGIYSHVGQLYEPVDSRSASPTTSEAKDGQMLEEGITEARLDVVVHRRRHGVLRRTA